MKLLQTMDLFPAVSEMAMQPSDMQLQAGAWVFGRMLISQGAAGRY
jgi:hypothetical protein